MNFSLNILWLEIGSGWINQSIFKWDSNAQAFNERSNYFETYPHIIVPLEYYWLFGIQDNKVIFKMNWPFLIGNRWPFQCNKMIEVFGVCFDIAYWLLRWLVFPFRIIASHWEIDSTSPTKSNLIVDLTNKTVWFVQMNRKNKGQMRTHTHTHISNLKGNYGLQMWKIILKWYFGMTFQFAYMSNSPMRPIHYN